MKFRSTNGNYFYFKLEQSDYEKYGFNNCKKLLNAMQKEFLPGERYWIKSIKSWAIKKTKRETMNHLVGKYLTGTKQKEFFDE